MFRFQEKYLLMPIYKLEKFPILRNSYKTKVLSLTHFSCYLPKDLAGCFLSINSIYIYPPRTHRNWVHKIISTHRMQS